MTENTPDNAAETWYSEREARLYSDKARVEAQEITLQNAYSNVESQWKQLNTQAETAFEGPEIVNIVEERQRLKNEAAQLENGWSALQQEKQQVDILSNLDYNRALELSSPTSQMFLRAWRSRIADDPSAFRKLLYHDNQIKASGVKPDSADYFSESESRMGFPGEERSREFENRQSTTKPKQAKEAKLTADQLEMARSLEGLDPAEYIKAAERTYMFDLNDDSHVYLDPNDSVQTSNEPEVRF